MKAIALGILLIIIACSNPAGSTTTAVASEGEPARLIADLTAAGAAAEQVEIFSGGPLGGTGALICIGSEEVRVYRFESEDDATEAAARIDPDDPSEIGTAIVEWAGNPRFWQRGTILVLYLGKDEDTESLLIEVLGSPFARGTAPGRGLSGVPGPCGEE